MSPLRRAAATLLVTALAGAGVAMAAVPAEATTTAYRYWSYWYVLPSASAWTYGQVGPLSHPVHDGSVEGWRFVVATPNPKAPTPRPDAATVFQKFCGTTTKPSDKVRVAVVVDYGTSADAPPHESPPGGVSGTCVLVKDKTNGLVALSDAGYAPRMGSGLVCGLSGYPATECGVVVKATPSPSPSKPAPTKTAAPPAPGTSPTKAPNPGASRSAVTPPPSPGSTPSSEPSTSTSGGPGQSPDPTESDAAVAIGPPPPPTGTSSGTPIGLLAGAALVVAVGAAAVLKAKGRGPGQQGTT